MADEAFTPVRIQSNSLRGEFMHNIVDRTINEIHEDIVPMFGPGASDAFITKEDAGLGPQIYYTRDGKEVLASLRFDNELATYVHGVLYQAVYNQGQKLGDGSTTLGVLYTELYKIIRFNKDRMRGISLNELRNTWNVVTEDLNKELKRYSVPMTSEHMMSLFYTCTQDFDLSARLYTKLRDAIMSGAYIVPRKSTIDTDFETTVYDQPMFKATRQFSLVPVEGEIKDAVILFCNGTLDLSHPEVLCVMTSAMVTVGNQDKPINFVILAHGLTQTTRNTLKEFVKLIKANGIDPRAGSNVIIYTMDEARMFSPDELEDVATIINDEKGLGGLVHPLTFEALLYRVFNVGAMVQIDSFEAFDMDPHLIDRMNTSIMEPYAVEYDEEENALTLKKPLGPNAYARYNELREAIAKESVGAKRVDLERRLRRSYGTFIDVEIGSTLLKDSQRKYELILDAIISSADGVKEGVLIGNSLIWAYKCNKGLRVHYETHPPENVDPKVANLVLEMLLDATRETFKILIANYLKIEPDEISTDLIKKLTGSKHDPADFNFAGGENYWPDKESFDKTVLPLIKFTDENGQTTHTRQRIVESLGSIQAIIKNSTLPLEIAMTEVFHISGKVGFMQNYIK